MRASSHALAPRSRPAFTLIELLVVISIISLLISILLPSLSRAREQAKGVHCVARLKEFGTGLAAYENISGTVLPPAEWVPDETDLLPGPEPVVPYRYGWAELLFAYVYQEEVPVRDDFPVQRNVDGRRWEKYFLCQAVGDEGVTSGHYRAYLPAWAGSPRLGPGGRWPEDFRIDPRHSGVRENIRLKLPLIGDANEFSERGDGAGIDDCSYIDAGEANIAGSDGHINGNRFSDRHSGGTNYLFADLHAAWSVRLRDELARDFDLNGVDDVDVAP